MNTGSPTGAMRTDLMWRLLLPLLAIVAGTGLMGLYGAHRLTDRTFDHALIDEAQALAAQVRGGAPRPTLELPARTVALMLQDTEDQRWYALRLGADTLSGDPAVPAMGDDLGTYAVGTAYDSTMDGQDVRVARVPVAAAPGAQLLVAETMRKRLRAEHETWLLLAPTAALLVAAALAIRQAVTRTIVPLEAMAARWRAHSQASLEAVDVNDVPAELLPFAHALNDLFGRTRAMMRKEREFCENASHQLRTPLAALELGLARAAAAPHLDAARDAVKDLAQATRRTSRLVDQLLLLARVDMQDGMPLSLAPLDLCTLARDIGTGQLDAADRKGVELELRTPDVPVQVQAQPELLGEALANLVDNAVQYTPAGGRVLIEVLAHPAELRVTDSGPGIPEAAREQLFERFARGTSSGRGSGLGLPIARDIAKLHGGTLLLANAPGAGLVARLLLG